MPTDVWVLALPNNSVAERLWDRAVLIPPETLLPDAEAALKTPGLALGGPYPIERISPMDDREIKAYLNRRSGGRRWKYFYADTSSARYFVVVVIR